MKNHYTLIFLIFFGTSVYAQLPVYVPSEGLVAWWGFNGDYLD